MHWNIIYIAINYKAFVCIFVRILIDRKAYYHIRAVRWRFSFHRGLCFVYVRNYQDAVMYIKLWTRYPFNFKSKFVKIRIITVLTESLPKVVFSTTNEIAIYCQQILTIIGLISSFHHYFHLNVSHRICFFITARFVPMQVFTFWSFWLSFNLYEDIVEIVVKYNKNIRRVEWMTSHPLQNALILA
jgi:hypothetical protein